MGYAIASFVAFGLGFAAAGSISLFYEWKYDRRLKWLSQEMARQNELQRQYTARTEHALMRLKSLDGKLGATKEEYELEVRNLQDVVRRIASQVDVAFSDNDKNDNLQERIVQELHMARNIVRIAMFTFTSAILTDMLERLRRREIIVKLLVDRGQLERIGTMRESCGRLSRAGAEVRTIDISESERGPFFHHKYCVVDEDVLITGSYNWTVQGDRENYENLLMVTNGVIAQRFSRHFEQVWHRGRS